jgi:acetyl esterase/lipase
MNSLSPKTSTVLAVLVGALVLLANSAFNPNGHSDLLLLATLFICSGYVFWRTRHLGARCVVAVGTVVGALMMVSMLFLFPTFSDQVLRADVAKGTSAALILFRPLSVIWVFGVLLSMLLATAALYTGRRRWIESGAAVTGMALLIGSLIAYAQANQAKPVGNYQRPAPLGVSADDVLLTKEHVPRAWEISTLPSSPPEAIVWKEVTYGPHGMRNRLNLFRPKNVDQPVPVVVYMHGGWCKGDKDGEGYQEPWVNALLANGIAVAPSNYRLSPSQFGGGDPNGALFPAQIQDVFSAVRFLRKNAAEYGIDPNQIVAMGHSGGGHLAALAGLASDVEDFHNDGWNLEVDHRVQAAVSLAGPTDLRISEDQLKFVAATLNYPLWEYLLDPNSPHDSAVNTLFLGGRRDHMDKVLRASPISHVSSGDPPLLLIHGFRDIQVSVHQSEALYCLLQETGVESEFHAIPGAGHPLAKHPGTSTPIVHFLQKHLKTAGSNP